MAFDVSQDNMPTELSADLKVPDLWFDFYARFLPGTGFLMALHFSLSPNWEVPTAEKIVIGIFLGYLAGLFAQPISSTITGLIHWGISKCHGEGRLFVEEAKRKVPEEARIINKMHGEATFFVQCGVLSIVLFVVLRQPGLCVRAEAELFTAWWVPVLLFVGAIVMSLRRFRRARDKSTVKAIVGN